MRIRIGTRGSKLALLQVRRVVMKLKSIIPRLEVKVKVIPTSGDFGQGRFGRFVREINRAVLEGGVDAGVHSLKDLPTKLPKGLRLACVPERLDPNDVLVVRGGSSLDDLPSKATVGTSSPRRRAELLHFCPNLRVVEIHGDLIARLNKMEAGFCDALVVARAALERLGMLYRVSYEFGLHEFVPAAGQGAIGVVCKEGELEFLAEVNDHRAWMETTCERAFMRELGPNLRSTAAAVARAEDGIKLIAVVHAGGRQILELEGENPEEVGAQAAKILRSRVVHA